MDRLDFCELLYDVKLGSSKRTADMSYIMHIPWSSVKRIEEGQTNFGIDSAIRYIGYLEHHMVLESFFMSKSYHILKYDDLITWMKESRKCKQTSYTQRTLAKVLGCSYVNIAKIESKKSIMSVDTFLQLIDIFVTKIKIVENEQNT